MGVPKFFRYISERYPCLSELVRENQVPEFDNLYLDMNGVIHNCSHPNDNDIHFRITEEQIFKDIFFYLETLFNMIKPQKLFFMAVDGVAPRAKMNQQRGRRFRSAKEAELQEEKARQKGEVLPSEARFDSNCITPGTPFMCRLNDAIRYFIQHKISTNKSWRDCKVILSGHETPGEGEHKIMEYIRFLKVQKGYDPNTRHCLYGLDADLIMLGLCTHERHFSLLREEVKFGKKNSKAVTVSQQRFFLLHLSLMREYLEQEFITLKGNMQIAFDIEKVIDDWVLMGFLVGNDFIPNIPNLHINSNALPMLYQAYIKTMTNLDGYINEGGTLNLARLQAYIDNLAQFDRDHFESTYDDLKFLESKQQSAFNTRNDDTFGGNQDLLNLVKATEFEFESEPEDDKGSSADENADDEASFEKEFHQHRRDYYVNKMKYEEMTPEVLAEQAECYIRALQWTLAYYYHGVQSWSWYYPHHYAPFISDVRNFKNFDIKFEMSAPFLPFQQLMSVLPAASRAHVPECYKKLMTNPDSELIDYYPVNFETDLNGKKQDWEAVVLIPFIDEKRLLVSLEKHDNELSPDEKGRNVHGPMYVYTYSRTSQGQLEALNFPSIGNLFCCEQKVYREEIQIPKNMLVLGPSKGALLNIYFTGFPTFKHLNYTSRLKNQNVKVFDQPSRGENMIIQVKHEEGDEKPINEISKQLMGKTVHVGWPHLIEAKIVRVSTNEITFYKDGGTDKTDPQKWRNDCQTIKDHHGSRMGIDVGEINRIVHVIQATGQEYKFDSSSKIFRLLKTYNPYEIAYPLQCVVQDIRTYRKKFKEQVPLVEAFKNGTEFFMLTYPCYGACGVVTDVNCFEKSGRVKVALTVPPEPDFSSVSGLHRKSQGAYMNSHQTASTLSISENVLNRITGTVLVIAGNKREISPEGQPKSNIGLQLKFPKANEEVAGYTKKDRMWFYSDKVIGLVQDYYCKFPVVFEVLGRKANGNDIYFESDFFDTTYGEENLSTLLKWLAQLPSQKAERRQIGTEAVEKEVLDLISKAVDSLKDAPMKKVTMQVKPHLIFAPSLNQTTVTSPDVRAKYELFDRVVVAKESEKYSVGVKGTVIGVSKIKDLNPVRQECLNKEDVYCDILFDRPVDGNSTGRIAIENLINISFGMQGNSNSKPTSVPVNDVKQVHADKTKQIEQRKPRENVKAQNEVTNVVSYSKILQKANSQHAPVSEKNNFADMWNALKTVGGEQTAEANQPSADFKASMTGMLKEAPVINAPNNLPRPPLEWLQAIPLKVDPPALVKQPNYYQNPPPMNNSNCFSNVPFFSNPGAFFASNNGMPIRPMAMPPMQVPLIAQPFPHQQINSQPQQRFFQNNQNQFNQRQKQPMSHNNGHPYQQRQIQPHQMPQQQANQQASNPFIPLQASRKATKPKNVQSELKKTQPLKEQQKPQKEVANHKPTVETASTSQETAIMTGSANPTVDNRKCRIAIDFSK